MYVVILFMCMCVCVCNPLYEHCSLRRSSRCGDAGQSSNDQPDPPELGQVPADELWRAHRTATGRQPTLPADGASAAAVLGHAEAAAVAAAPAGRGDGGSFGARHGAHSGTDSAAAGPHGSESGCPQPGHSAGSSAAAAAAAPTDFAAVASSPAAATTGQEQFRTATTTTTTTTTTGQEQFRTTTTTATGQEQFRTAATAAGRCARYSHPGFRIVHIGGQFRTTGCSIGAAARSLADI